MVAGMAKWLGQASCLPTQEGGGGEEGAIGFNLIGLISWLLSLFSL